MSPVEFLSGKVVLHPGDCLATVKALPDASIDGVVTDPPYALVSIAKRWGKPDAKSSSLDAYARAAAGFMGKQWDTGEVAFAVEFWAEVLRVLKPGGHVIAFSGTRTYHRLACAIEDAGFEIRDQIGWLYGTGFPKSHNLAGDWQGWGTALKPAWEPMVLARKPLAGTVAANVLAHGTGALNVDGCRIDAAGEIISQSGERVNTKCHAGYARPGASMFNTGKAKERSGPASRQGRHPANIVHDGSDEVMSAFPDAPGQQRYTGPEYGAKDSVNCYGDFGPIKAAFPRGDSGSAARFFYSAKADSQDRIGSKHPTVKPVDLMRWLCRLITPPGGVVLDPFAGTGTTGEAAFLEGFRAVLCEREEEYQADIARRMALVLAGPDEKTREIIKAKGVASDDLGPLFTGAA